MPEGYNLSIEGYTVINTHIINTTEVNVTKVWNDDDNRDGVRETEVIVELYANGMKVNGVTLNEDNNWKHTFNNLPVYKEGKKINYTITENNVTGYNTSITNISNDYTIVNTHIPENVTVNVIKVWNDSDNNDGIRPEEVSVQLYANGNKTGNPILLNANNNWKYSFENLAKYDNGQLIVYTVIEENVGNYNTTVINNTSYEFTIVNTHILDVVDLNIKKVWNDTDNCYAKRPNNVTVNVYANGNRIESVTLNEENNWSCVIGNLTKFNNGTLIKYTVDEDKVKYYNSSIEVNDSYDFTVTNTLKAVKKFMWAWKLVGINESYYVIDNGEYDYDTSISKHLIKNNGKLLGRTKGIGKYQPRHKVPNKNSKLSSNKKNKGKYSYLRRMSREKYRLYIFLYRKYFFGDMSYSDFIAILKENGIELTSSNGWNSEVVLIFDYYDLEKVPDSIELHDNGGHVKDSSDRVQKYNPKGSSGVIDEGQVEVEVVEIEE